MPLSDPPNRRSLKEAEERALWNTPALKLFLVGFALVTFLFLRIGAFNHFATPLFLCITLLSAYLYQRQAISQERPKRWEHLWAIWLNRREDYFRQKIDDIIADKPSISRTVLDPLLSVRRDLISAVKSDDRNELEEHQLSYLLKFDGLADSALTALQEHDERQPLTEVIKLGEKLIEEIPLVLSPLQAGDDFDYADFQRELDALQDEHAIKVGVSRRLQADKIKPGSA
ncbi:MAG: hypothetical protein Q7Q71_05910 [Verrucomicrobiota bacterium JB023]|nr:hypothetical protein [Verrucomicrobiota bacterium JB023]